MRDQLITFDLRHGDGEWYVAKATRSEDGTVVKEARRSEEWRSNAAIDHVAAALALLTIKRDRGLELVLDSEADPIERDIIVRCSNAGRNATTGTTKWIDHVLGRPVGPSGASRNPLKELFVVGRRAPTTLRLAAARSLDEFRFVLAGGPASRADLLAFVRAQVPLAVGERRAERAKPVDATLSGEMMARVDRDNIHGRLKVAIIGERVIPLGEGNPMLDPVLKELARDLADGVAHLIVGVDGLGVAILKRISHSRHSPDLTYTIVPGPDLHIIAPADVVLLIGGRERTFRQMRLAFDLDKTILPVLATKGAAWLAFWEMDLHQKLWMSDESCEELARGRTALDVCHEVRRLLEQVAKARGVRLGGYVFPKPARASVTSEPAKSDPVSAPKKTQIAAPGAKPRRRR